MSRLAIAAKATIISQVFRLVGLGLSFVTVPLYLAWLGQDRYGLLLTASSLTSILMLSNGGLNWASMLLISQASGRGDRPAIQTLVRNSFSLNLALGGVVAALVTLAVGLRRSGHVVPLVPDHPEMNDILIVLGATVVYRFLISPISGLFIGLQQLSTDSILQGVGATLGTLAGLGVAALGGTIAQILLAQLLGSVLLGAWSCAVCVRRNSWAFKAGPLWERAQLTQLFRSATKSLTMQAGVVLWSSAPVVILSKMVGPSAVPLFTVPNTLLGVPYGLIANFNGTLQAAYGEAFGQGDLGWIRGTLNALTRRTFILIVLIAAGFLVLAPSFVKLWTGGALSVPYGYFVSTLLCFLASTPLLVFRGALAGMNRHRIAAMGDLLSGALAFVLAWALVKTLPSPWIGLAPTLATLPLWWIFPRQFAAITSVSKSALPDVPLLARLALLSAGTLFAGWASKSAFLPGEPTWLGLVATGLCTTAAFWGLGAVSLGEDFKLLYAQLRGMKALVTRSPRP